ncbi:MAG: DUF998 domain-containing protein [Candidatus Hermodarchaeia archaeon]
MSNDEEAHKTHPVRDFIFSSRFAGVCGIIGPLIAITGIAIAISVSLSWFNWWTNALSDLGHPWMLGGSNGTPGYNPAAPIFNSALSITGLVTLVLTIWMIRYEYFERSTLGVVAAILLTISQFFLIGIGVFHEGYGDLHFIVSVGFFATLILAGMLFGIRLILEKETRIFGVFAFILAFSSMLVWVLYYLSFTPFTGVAIPEIVSAIAAMIWVYPLCIRIIQQKD